MKLFLLVFVIFAPAFSLFAQSDSAREFKQLNEQRDRALAAAAEPINQRYKTDLEQLLRRATQSNDLTTALAIKEVLERLGRAVSGNGSLTSPVGTWTFHVNNQSYTRVFGDDGTVTGEGFRGTGSWKIVKGKVVITYPEKGEGTLDLPLNPQGSKGHSHNGESFTAVRVSP